ncbi:MAG: HPr family phosphocarrier protein [Actinomycetota bacterium]|nr:HPr family phosphocarrier protein [Actinomycetota bacterium]
MSTVGVAVVAHSPALVVAAVELSRAMSTGADVRIETATVLADDSLDDDAAAVAAAVRAADRGAGVLVVTDMGSAVEAAEKALLIIDAELRQRVRVSPGPLVEGLVAAVAAASSGSTLAEVAEQATGALQAKQRQFGVPPGPGPGPDGPVKRPDSPAGNPADDPTDDPTDDPADERVGSFTVTVPNGLHARPAGALVQSIVELDAEVWLCNRTDGGMSASARSLLAITTLGAHHGHEVEVSARGPQAQLAMDRVLALAERGFDQ